MTGAEAIRALGLRVRRPGAWVGLLAFLLVYYGVQFFSGYFGQVHGVMLVEAILGPASLFAACTFLSPVPWQWNGSRTGPPSFLRGVIQSLIYCEAVITLLMCLSWGIYTVAGQEFQWTAFLLTNLGLVGSIMIAFGRIQARREAEESEKDAARADARLARTRLLQSQLHPHVLFNALNGIAELILKDPPAAERTVRNLSDLLRQLLEVSETGTIPLAAERLMVENYLAIESMRLGERLDLRWEWDEALDTVEVIPLLLQPLVENAVKHGIAPREEGGRLSIRAALEGGRLRLEVSNPGEPALKPAGRIGIGLKNLRARLEAAYSDGASFSLEGRAGRTEAVVWIDLSRGLGATGAK